MRSSFESNEHRAKINDLIPAKAGIQHPQDILIIPPKNAIKQTVKSIRTMFAEPGSKTKGGYMKKVWMVVAVAAVTMFAWNAMAGFNVPTSIPTTGRDAVNTAAKGGVAVGINKELAKPKYKCEWNAKASKLEGCDPKTIASYLSAQHAVVEKAGAKRGTYTDNNIKIHCVNNKCFNTVKTELQKLGVGSWDIDNETAPNNTVFFTVNIE